MNERVGEVGEIVIEIVQVQDEHRLEQVIAFIAALNAQPEHQIGYMGEVPASIRAELAERNPNVVDIVFVALAEGQVVGAIVLDADAEVGRSWVFGPWAVGAERDDIADALWTKLLPHIPADAREAELFCHLGNLLVRSFAERLGFTTYKEAVILAARRDTVLLDDAPDVRQLEEVDHAAFTRLHDTTFPRTYITGPQIIARIAESPERAVFTVGDTSGLLGYLYAEVTPESGDANIELVAVDELARGRGYGKQLVSAALIWIFAWSQVNEVFLNTEPENAAALGLYERAGFQRRQAMISFRKVI